MNLTDATRPVFARHETFHPRYSWFRKAYEFTENDPDVFFSEDATVKIGVGKNMVRSIRFWGIAAKLISEQIGSRRRGLSTTIMGNKLFGTHGWDKYMQDTGTLWLLHWLLLSPPSQLPIWWLTFNKFSAVEFTSDQLLDVVSTYIDNNQHWATPHQSSIKKDIRTLLRTYATRENLDKVNIDEFLDCPLRELNLINYYESTRSYRFVLGTKPTLPSEILAYALLDFVSCLKEEDKTITINRLATESGSPGKVFKLNEQEILESIEPVIKNYDSVELISTMNNMQLTWSEETKSNW